MVVVGSSSVSVWGNSLEALSAVMQGALSGLSVEL